MSAYTHLFSAPQELWPELVLSAVIQLYDVVFPDRVRSVYKLGSRAEGAAGSTSDIDAIIVFKGNFRSDEEISLADAVASQCNLISPLRLDLTVIAEENRRDLDPRDIRLTQGGILVFGEDTRSKWPAPKVEEYQQFILDWALLFVLPLHRVKEFKSPLSAPDPRDSFLGYTKVHRVAWYPAGTETGTKEFVAAICWVATAMLALGSDVIVSSRSECIEQVPIHLEGRWSRLVQTAYHRCRGDWSYEVPKSEAGRVELSELCNEALAFFNVFAKLTETKRV